MIGTVMGVLRGTETMTRDNLLAFVIGIFVGQLVVYLVWRSIKWLRN